MSNPKTVVIEVYGGNVTAVQNLPEGTEFVVLDWDNLLGDMYTRGDCKTAWDQFDIELQDWIRTEYPTDYAKIQQRIAEDEAVIRG